MAVKMRDILLRKDLFIVSRNKFKRAMLTGYLSAMCVLIGMFYTAYQSLYNIPDAYFAYYILIGAGLTAFMANRNGHHTTAKVIFLLTGNFVVFLFSTKEHFQTDAHFFYIILCLGAFAVFGYENWRIAFLFSLLTIGLFWITFTTDYSLVPYTNYPVSYIRANQVINFITALLTTCVILYTMVRLNYRSEAILDKKQQEITRQNQALTKANAELDRFVYSASHDLRAPLTSILGLIHIAKKTDDPKEVLQCLDMLTSRVHRLDDFIKEIIDVSRNARLEILKLPIAIKPLLHEVLENLKYAKHPSLNIKVDVQQEAEFKTDVSRLKIILSNLIANAIKYQDLAKESPFVSIQLITTPAGMTITVHDNGIGISPEHHDKIFTMFYRASEQSEGSGLGLYITKEAVEKLGGTIQFSSTPGTGSEFTVQLPH
jgi:signal transduction histidine kinase